MAEPFEGGLSAVFWAAISRGVVGAIIWAQRMLTVHERAEDSPDGRYWIENGLQLPGPVGNISKLVVDPSCRGQGLASRLNAIRLDAAKDMGCRTMTVTASESNARLLAKLGFVDTGVRMEFDNRPGVEFRALELDMDKWKAAGVPGP
ncbi:hypothetical protein DFJ74DRAFT_713642 [Hyaloraphidium curvatum]|nr:hypothetical protein DFJ74DRAFT_713642 [Hyaloraphidium curvatum]